MDPLSMRKQKAIQGLSRQSKFRAKNPKSAFFTRSNIFLASTGDSMEDPKKNLGATAGGSREDAICSAGGLGCHPRKG
jgi:hypothetical protein